MENPKHNKRPNKKLANTKFSRQTPVIGNKIKDSTGRREEITAPFGKLLLSINPLNLSVGDLCILTDTSLSLELGRHYALVGKNGIGKTTLLNEIANNTLTESIIYVKQEENTNQDISILDFLISSNDRLLKQYQRFLELETMNQGDIEMSNELMDEYVNLLSNVKPLYMKEVHRANKILLGLGFKNFSCKVSEYSGGWRMRLSLAKGLFRRPELLLLDEPSNHLDLSASIWLSEYLKDYPNTVLLVSHDKFLIEETCTTIIFMNNHKLTYYNCDYDKFQKQLALEHDKSLRDWNNLEKQILGLKRKGTSKSDIEAFIKNKKITKPKHERIVKMKFLQPSTIRSPYIMVNNVTFGYSSDNMILENIVGGTRMALVGDNGVGKSTLFKLLNDELVPLKGEIIKEEKLTIGY